MAATAAHSRFSTRTAATTTGMGCAGGKPVADKPDSSSPRATGDVKLKRGIPHATTTGSGTLEGTRSTPRYKGSARADKKGNIFKALPSTTGAGRRHHPQHKGDSKYRQEAHSQEMKHLHQGRRGQRGGGGEGKPHPPCLLTSSTFMKLE